MTHTTLSCLWNDSAAVGELTYSIEHGAVGATCNPVIALEVLRKEMHPWRGRIHELVREMPAATEVQIGWRVVEEMSIKGAQLLKPIFDPHKGRNGRLSIQTDPHCYRDPQAFLERAVYFSGPAPNMIVKIHVTRAGIDAIEEATFRGVSINATVCFTLPQSIAVAEAVERGLRRREKDGKDISTVGPVCTITVGPLGDWLKAIAERENITTDHGRWTGPAWLRSRRRIASSASAATGSGCCRPPSGITCAGASS